MWKLDKGSKALVSELRGLGFDVQPGRMIPPSVRPSKIVSPPQRSILEFDCDICTCDLFSGGLSRKIEVLSKDESSRRICKGCHERIGSIIDSFVRPVKGYKTILDPIWEIKMHLNEMSQRQQEQFTFFSEIAGAFRDHLHTDILVKPGRENGPAIPAHKAVLAAKSVVFKNMLDSEKCKDPTSFDSITVPEMNHEELQTFLEFLYRGHLPSEETSKHCSSLLRAARDYKIPYLEKFCGLGLNKSLSENNVLDFLEIADACSDEISKDKALQFIKRHKCLLLSPRYDSLVHKNPRLAIEITRYLANVFSKNEKGSP